MRCKCGYVFVTEVEAQQSRGLAGVRYLRRNRMVQKITVLFSALAIVVVVVAAYFGSSFRTPVVAEEDLERRSLIDKPSTTDPNQNQAAVPNLIFPEPNVPYKVTRAFTGAVIGVMDANNTERRVTLFGIRAPKLDEDLGVESRDFVSNLIAGKTVIIKRRGATKEAETIAEVLADGINIGLEQIRQGMGVLNAEAITSISQTEQQPYLEAASIAKNSRSGVWGDKKDGTAAIAPIRAEPLEKDRAEPEVRNDSPTKRQRPAAGTAEQPVDYTSVPKLEASISEVDKPIPNASKPANDENDSTQTKPDKTPASGGKYVRGPRGGCYYITPSGNKAYVDRSKCN